MGRANQHTYRYFASTFYQSLHQDGHSFKVVLSFALEFVKVIACFWLVDAS